MAKSPLGLSRASWTCATGTRDGSVCAEFSCEGLRHRPLWRQLFDPLGQAVHTGLSVGHGMNVVLQNELARRVIEAHRGEPATVRQGPALLASIDTPMWQQEALEILPRLTEHTHRRGAGSHQVAHGLMRRIRTLHRRQLAAPVQLGQHRRVRRSVLTRPPAFIGISEGATTMQLCPSPVSCRCRHIRTDRLRSKSLPAGPLAKLLRQFGDLIGAIGDDPQVTNVPAAHPFGHRNRNRRLVHIQPTKMLSFIRPAPCLRLGAGPSGATLDRSLPRGGPPVTSEGEHRV